MSRQREWQKRMIAAGRCRICGKATCVKSGKFCEKHRQADVEQKRTARERAKQC